MSARVQIPALKGATTCQGALSVLVRRGSKGTGKEVEQVAVSLMILVIIL